MTSGLGATGLLTPLFIGDVLGGLDSIGVPVTQLLQMADSIAFIILAAIGLTVIFGMMGVINLAHGEFIMMGAYITTLSVNVVGLPLPVAMILGALGTAAFGAIIERTIVRRLYGRLLDSMIVTFGLGLILTQGTRIIFGNSLQSIGTPFGNVPGYTYSAYRVLLLFAAIAVLGGAYLVFTRTEFGIQARATIQDAETARTMGVDTDRMYTVTFAIGSGLAGLTGALYAPSATIVPGMGQSFLVESFVTVVTGGSTVLLGTTLAGGVLGTIDAIFSNLYGNFIGQIALLITAIIVIRLLPDGLTGLAHTIRDKLGERQ
ncbi:urea ABC transporter, permease protein UrtB [Halonotius roseus]|uniref:Urea ABC transporter, permease protein UrtB n=1 Tax=Halonotius roseus TaxID=2511997 RepID=A0A544QMQ5_9EURY|nr:urea ABC transporter, permease protein UrtB [Halonotius roseus]TQQ80145.1 urea ABC transporter, permease protein UrtB [Halonotius roseus]